MCLPPSPELRIVVKRGKEDPPLEMNARWLETTGYAPILPKKKYTLTVEEVEGGKTVGKVEFEAGKGQFFTVLAKPGIKGVDVSVINDTYTFDFNAPGEATFYMFIPGYTVTITAPEGGTPKTIKYGQSAVFSGLPQKAAPIAIKIVQDSDGKTGERKFDLDFGNTKRFAFLFVLDRYEEFDLRTESVGYSHSVGETLAPEPSPVADAPSATPTP